MKGLDTGNRFFCAASPSEGISFVNKFGFNLNFAHNVILLKPFDELKLIAVLSNFPCNLSTDCKSSLC